MIQSVNLRRARWLAAMYACLIVIMICLANGGQWDLFHWIRSIPGADKTGHFLLFGGLAFVANRALGLRMFTFAGRQWLCGSAVVGTLVLMEEVSQMWFPARSFDPVDLLFDFAGILFFGWMARKVDRPAVAPQVP